MKQRQVAVLCWLAIVDAALVLGARASARLWLAIVLAVTTAVAVGLAGGD